MHTDDRDDDHPDVCIEVRSNENAEDRPGSSIRDVPGTQHDRDGEELHEKDPQDVVRCSPEDSLVRFDDDSQPQRNQHRFVSVDREVPAAPVLVLREAFPPFEQVEVVDVVEGVHDDEEAEDEEDVQLVRDEQVLELFEVVPDVGLAVDHCALLESQPSLP